jgi:hypothetical protein
VYPLDEVGEVGENGNDRGLRQSNERYRLLALHSQMSALQRSFEDVRASLEPNSTDWREARREFQIMMQSSANIRRIALPFSLYRVGADLVVGPPMYLLVRPMPLNLKDAIAGNRDYIRSVDYTSTSTRLSITALIEPRSLLLRVF